MRDPFLFHPSPSVRNRGREFSRSGGESNDDKRAEWKALSINSRGWVKLEVDLRWVGSVLRNGLKAGSLFLDTVTFKTDKTKLEAETMITELISKRFAKVIKTRVSIAANPPFQIQRARWKVKEHYPSSKCFIT